MPSLTSVPDVVVLAGGHGRRLGGVDKALLDVGGRTILDRVLAAVPVSWPVVCVGPKRATARSVSWVQESPAGAGPVAALRAGLDAVTGDVVVLLAADLPFLTTDAVTALAASVEPGSGVVALDDGGREQWLLSAWPTSLLRASVRGVPDDGSLRAVLGGVRHAAVGLPARGAAPWFDCDSPTDLDRARRIHDAGGVG